MATTWPQEHRKESRTQSAEIGEASEDLREPKRSPHPYHRRSRRSTGLNGVANTDFSSSGTVNEPASNWSSSSSSFQAEEAQLRTKSRPIGGSPGDSGTEADDEGRGGIKALPAPPPKSHKGLKDASGEDEGLTPLLTPTSWHEESRRLRDDYFTYRRPSTRTKSELDEEARQAIEKFVKRRRAELLRRLSEFASLCVLGFIVVQRGRSGSWP